MVKGVNEKRALEILKNVYLSMRSSSGRTNAERILDRSLFENSPLNKIYQNKAIMDIESYMAVANFKQAVKIKRINNENFLAKNDVSQIKPENEELSDQLDQQRVGPTKAEDKVIKTLEERLDRERGVLPSNLEGILQEEDKKGDDKQEDVPQQKEVEALNEKEQTQRRDTSVVNKFDNPDNGKLSKGVDLDLLMTSKEED
jgi:hypothetical protein